MLIEGSQNYLVEMTFSHKCRVLASNPECSWWSLQFLPFDLANACFCRTVRESSARGGGSISNLAEAQLVFVLIEGVQLITVNMVDIEQESNWKLVTEQSKWGLEFCWSLAQWPWRPSCCGKTCCKDLLIEKKEEKGSIKSESQKKSWSFDHLSAVFVANYVTYHYPTPLPWSLWTDYNWLYKIRPSARTEGF